MTSPRGIPDRVRDMTEQYQAWASVRSVISREKKIIEFNEGGRRGRFLGRREAEIATSRT